MTDSSPSTPGRRGHPADAGEQRRIVPGDAARGEVQILDEREVWGNGHARFLLARVRQPAGDDGEQHEGEEFRLVPSANRGDGVVVAAIDGNDDRLLLVRQFRHPVRLWMRELPRGAREEGETPEDAARRELHEELGATTLSLHPLGRLAADSGQVGSLPYLIAARVRLDRTPERDDGEAIAGVDRMSYTGLRAAAESGEVLDGFTLAAVVRLAPHFDGDRFHWRDDRAPRSPSLGDTSDEGRGG